MGKRVLAIDLDPQGNMTSGLGVDKNEVENTVYEPVSYTHLNLDRSPIYAGIIEGTGPRYCPSIEDKVRCV